MPTVTIARALGAVVLCLASTAHAQEAPPIWSCELMQRLGGQKLQVALGPDGACWRDWDPLDNTRCKAIGTDEEVIVDLPGRGQMMGSRWIIERGRAGIDISGCRFGERPRDEEPRFYQSTNCVCRRTSLAAAGAAWRKVGGLDAGIALLTPHLAALVAGAPPAPDKAALAALAEFAVLHDQRQAPGDAEAAHRYATVAARYGDAEAAFLVGRSFELGRGVGTDLVAAATWYRQAADGGSRRAMTALGILLEQGAGVKVDLAEALRWYRAAVDAGSTSGMLRLGLLYRQGKGVERDLVTAYQWLFGASLTEDRVTKEAALRERDGLAASLTSAQRAEAESRFRTWHQAHKANQRR